MKLYHFINVCWGLLDLKNRHLKVSRMNELNDPFEFKLFYSSCPERLDKTISYLSNNFGMLCFSEDWHNPVQWAHYADKHQGLCFGFEVGDGIGVEIQYSDDRKNADDDVVFAKLIETADDQISDKLQEEGKELVKSMLSTKFSHWGYEKEHRIYLDLSEQTEWGARDATGRYFYYFSKNLANIKLTEVNIGLRSNTSFNEVEEALGNLANDVEVFKVRIHDKKFEMERYEADVN